MRVPNLLINPNDIVDYHRIGAETKWSPFCRRRVQCNWPWILFYFDSNFTDICFQWSKLQWSNIGSDNKWQPVIWTKGGIVSLDLSAQKFLQEKSRQKYVQFLCSNIQGGFSLINNTHVKTFTEIYVNYPRSSLIHWLLFFVENIFNTMHELGLYQYRNMWFNITWNI